MHELLSQATPAERLDPSLQVLVEGGFVETEGCVFLAVAGAAPEGELLDATGREALVNHVHIEGCLAASAGEDAIAQAARYARALAERLDAAFPAYAFHVVLAVGDSPTVRFYRVRSDEPAWISTDLEGYANEAVLVLKAGAECG